MNRSTDGKKDLVIVCEDSYGLDLFVLIETINRHPRGTGTYQYNVIGFLSDRDDPFGNILPPAPVLGTIEEWTADDGIFLVMGIRDPYRKENAVKMLKSKEAHFETLIAPWVLLPFEFETGEGCIIGNYSCKYRSKFGDFVTLDTVMCETVEVGDYSTLCPFANITSARIGKRVYVGSHAAIMSHKTVGDDSYIYPGSIVVKDVKAGSVIAGVPATKAFAKKWRKQQPEVDHL